MRAPYDQAVDTVRRLHGAARDGLPVLIPGARETRPAAADATAILADPVAASARAAAVFERVRLEREREPEKPPRTLLARIWRRMFRGAE